MFKTFFFVVVVFFLYFDICQMSEKTRIMDSLVGKNCSLCFPVVFCFT